MDDAEKIDRIITVMQELQELVNQIDDNRADPDMIIGIMIALIVTTPIPNVTILPNYRDHMAYA
tara:strand:+ start:44 stop:235 length:192 start_codon:yes stop_codon:yes gene_type:complete